MPRPPKPSAKVDISESERLPVHPRRKKVPAEERKRVATACNRCNVKRIKCSGESPCRQCSASQRPCQYPEPIEKVLIPRAELDALRRKCALFDGIWTATSTMTSATTCCTPTRTRGCCPPSPTPWPAHRATVGNGGKILADTDGTERYLGETSGATFLDHLKSFIKTSGTFAFLDQPHGVSFVQSIGVYQTYDSRPLQLPTGINALWLPSQPQMAEMLNDLTYFINDGNGRFPSGGILFWPLQDAASIMASAADQTPPQTHRDLALYHAAFAFASLLQLTEVNSKVEGQLGEPFFARARMLLGNPLDFTLHSSDDAVVLALMALYLVENNRRDAAYIAIGNAMQVSIMHGTHRGLVADEVKRRTFWTVYILDRWLSCLQGRPPGIPEDAVQVPLPQPCFGLPPPDGLRAHIALSRISDFIVRNSYQPQARDGPNRAIMHIERVMQQLSEWLAHLPDTLRPPVVPDSPDVVEVPQITDAPSQVDDRACCVLHMAYNQGLKLIILTIRPMFLAAVKKAVADGLITGRWSIDEHPHVERIKECGEAARRNLRLGRWVRRISPRQKLLLQDLHHIFNGAVILMLHQIGFANMLTRDSYLIEFALEVFDREAATGSNYGKDCVKVLRDLLALVRRLRARFYGDDPDLRGPLPGEQALMSLRNMAPPPTQVDPVDVAMMDALGFDPGQLTIANFPEQVPFQEHSLDLATVQEILMWWGLDYQLSYGDPLTVY
ncbi:hypothetical protein B0T26DRAFT_743379 [Lasiosphaeria miniovina]|uniref:Zn(2)-C6 fungal-type domain-containing protein n=1 Tax=Lasiosphaeria miniovina TaxID=1954250 RepID=A0AA40DSF4_9PEZI|nr:uncharacterized protein B0T26DRAFT_743379 [Lasiosphaeria miniovina]KAK0710283.1 hypothetical protein B0T26DRAFT_743379 [Lasiosphaeria miniovina]